MLIFLIRTIIHLQASFYEKNTAVVKLKQIIIKSLIALLFFSLVLSSCSKPTLRSAAKNINANPALYLIEKGDSKAYLFGSIHYLPDNIRWYGPKISRAFDTTEELVLESVNSAQNTLDAEVSQYLKEHGLLPEGRTLDKYLTEAQYNRLVDITDKLGFSRDRINQMRPWFLRLIMSREMLEKSGLSYNQGVDQLFEDEAKRRDLPIYALETQIEALKSLAGQPLSAQIKSLKKSLSGEKQPPDKKSNLVELLSTWMRGDIEQSGRVMKKDLNTAMYQRIIVRRNLLWLPRIERLLDKPQQSMIVVGVGHMGGRDGLVGLLKKRGYKVARVQ